MYDLYILGSLFKLLKCIVVELDLNWYGYILVCIIDNIMNVGELLGMKLYIGCVVYMINLVM